MKHFEIANTIIQFIESNLADQKPDLNSIAEATHYSKYYIHRIFSNTVGLSIHNYTKRRQLTEAARQLNCSGKTIIEIALEAGYDSQQSFSNAFKAMYKVSPDRFRKSGEFYPLQLKYEFHDEPPFSAEPKDDYKARLVTDGDIPSWMELAHLAVDGFPHLDDQQHTQVLKQYIAQKSALVMEHGGRVIGSLMVNYEDGTIDFLAVHPLYHREKTLRRMLNLALAELCNHRQVSIITFRAGDRADTGHRQALENMGFAGAESLTAFDYPVQKMILRRELADEKPIRFSR